MKMEQIELPGDVLKVKLIGALDIAGAADIDMPFSVVAGSRNKVAVDFSELTFLASIGIRVLVKAARSIARRGGNLVIYKASDDARRILSTTGIDAIIPVLGDEAAAVAELGK